MGHVIGLLDIGDMEEARELTMYGRSGTARLDVTLGLGDVLGARKLYPCECPLPPIYDP